MDWFRWHHGSVTDPKFQVVARRAGASVAEVVAVWACLLEAASANEADRGNIGNIDLEAIECLLGLPESRAFAICQAMDERNLLDFSSGRVGAWERRQPKREREDNSTERSRAFRERQRAAQQDQAKERHATTCNATETTETPRLEESREEKKKQEHCAASASPAFSPSAWLQAKGVDETVARDFIALRKSKKAALTLTALEGIEREAAKARMPLGDALRTCCERGWQGFKAEWLADKAPNVTFIARNGVPHSSAPTKPRQML
ncbi:TPA_asm: putative replication protein O [Cyanophage Cy-LDV1]|nr:TPA_asm: putative replication protein O [Cyanophage Cy-LDV1]